MNQGPYRSTTTALDELAPRQRRISGWCGLLALLAMGAGFASCGVDLPSAGISLVLVIAPALACIGLGVGLFSREPRWSRAVGILSSLLTLASSGWFWWAATHFRIPGGRPFRVAGRRHQAQTRTESGSTWPDDIALDASHLDATARARLTHLWTEEARAEHASVASFAQVSLDLIALGAPPALLEAAHRAALDEVRHARICLGLARAYSREGVAFAPSPEFGSPRPPPSLESLARDALVEGCLHEGFAARLLAERAARAPAAKVRDALSAIAEDEARHAELSWDIVAFCMDRGGQPIRHALRHIAADLGPLPGPFEPDAEERGRIDTSRVREIWRACVEHVVTRCEALDQLREVPGRSPRAATGSTLGDSAPE